MLSILKPIGEKNTVHLILSYDGPNVTVTASIIPNEDKLRERGTRTLQFYGPVAEVEAALPTELAKGVEIVTAYQSNLAEIEAEAKATKEKVKKKPESKPEQQPEPKEETVKKKAEAAAPAVTTATKGLDLDALIAEANAKK